MKKDLHTIIDNDFPEQSSERKILEYSSKLKAPFELSSEETLILLKQKIALKESKTLKPKSNTRILYKVISIAATALVFLTVGFLFLKSPKTEILAAKGQHTSYELPDGSEVMLNADSKISFKSKKFTSKRIVGLEGEAFFKIKKGGAFTISTQHADIRILGTSFNVYSRENTFKASCVTGKVLISSGKQNIVITPGESVEYNNNILNKYTDKNINNITNWRNGEFYFENKSLTLIFNEIERQYNVTFVLPKTDDKYFTGSFTNKNLFDALDIVCIPMGLTYEIGTNSKIIIKERIQ
jgi:transmembrane sensor